MTEERGEAGKGTAEKVEVGRWAPDGMPNVRDIAQRAVGISPAPVDTRGGKAKGRRSMEDYKTTGSEELWISSMPQDRRPEGNLKLWRDAEDVLDGLCKMYEFGDTERGGIEHEDVHQALVDVYNRAIEERRR